MKRFPTGVLVQIPIAALSVAVFLAVPCQADAQSLGDVAKKTAAEREKRATDAKTPPKTVSNKDLVAESGSVASVAPAPTPTPETVVATAPKGDLDQKTFEGVYSAAKAIDGATSVGVNYVRFRDLVQQLSAGVSIAKDRAPFTDREAALLALFQNALTHYDNSSIFWKLQTETTDAIYNGEIPIFFETPGRPGTNALVSLAVSYGIPVTDRIITPPLPAEPKRYKAVPGNAMQKIWAQASTTVAAAAALYTAK